MAGLKGQVAGETALCTVGKEGTGLTYRGYDIQSLAKGALFEEVAYLLIEGELPDREALSAFKERLQDHRGVPELVRTVLEQLPADAHPMDVLRSGVSALGSAEPETDFAEQQGVAERLLGVMPSFLFYWYGFAQRGERVDTVTDSDTLAGHFLELLYGESADDLAVQVLNASLVLYAEHEFNASTFTGRIIASTLSDMYSAVAGAIGALRGPLHGGANEAAMAMLADFGSPDEAEEAVLGRLERKEKVPGFGHAVYTSSDPRHAIIKEQAKKLAERAGDETLFPIAERVEAVMDRERGLFPNTDFYHALAYHYLDIPTELFTPIFVCSRLSGWVAHVMEQRANNKLIRPSASYVGPDLRDFVPLGQR